MSLTILDHQLNAISVQFLKNTFGFFGSKDVATTSPGIVGNQNQLAATFQFDIGYLEGIARGREY
jgi:hypothetical protein